MLIGYKDTTLERKSNWLKMIESKRSYEAFSKGPTEHELSIAKVDKDIYNYYLNKYVA